MPNKNIFDTISLRELTSAEGTTFSFGNEFTDFEEEYLADQSLNLTDSELIRLINMHEFLEEDDVVEDDIPLSIGLFFDSIKQKMVDLTPDGKIKKIIRQQGVGPVIPPDCLVTIRYSGYFDGQDEPYDSSVCRGKPDRYQLGQGQLIPGFEMAIASMRKFEAAIFFIHPDFGFGELGCPPLIPPNAEIMYVVSLDDYLDNATVVNFESLSVEDKKKFQNVKANAQHVLKIGADNFKRKKYTLAIRDYRKVIDLLENSELQDEEEEIEMKKLLSKAYQNLAICYNRENLPRQACMACHQAPYKTSKTHFHYGRALIRMGEYKSALEELKKCLKLDPENVSTMKEIELATKLQNKYSEIEKKMWSKCLGLSHEQNNKEDEHDELAAAFCKEFFDNNHLMRQPIPEGLSSATEAAIRKHAAILGLKVTSHVRYEKEIIYLSKPSYI